MKMSHQGLALVLVAMAAPAMAAKAPEQKASSCALKAIHSAPGRPHIWVKPDTCAPAQTAQKAAESKDQSEEKSEATPS